MRATDWISTLTPHVASKLELTPHAASKLELQVYYVIICSLTWDSFVINCQMIRQCMGGEMRATLTPHVASSLGR